MAIFSNDSFLSSFASLSMFFSAKSALQLTKISSDEPTGKYVNMIKGSKRPEDQEQVGNSLANVVFLRSLV